MSIGIVGLGFGTQVYVPALRSGRFVEEQVAGDLDRVALVFGDIGQDLAVAGLQYFTFNELLQTWEWHQKRRVGHDEKQPARAA